MKAWWEQLSAQERQTVSIGGIVLGLLLLWFMILSPIHRMAESAREEYRMRATLISWMKPRVEMIKTLRTKSTSQKSTTSANLLSTVEQALAASPIAHEPHDLSQKSADSVGLNFDEIEYSLMMKWLSTLQQNYGIKVIEAHLKRGSKPAIINANLVLGIE